VQGCSSHEVKLATNLTPPIDEGDCRMPMTFMNLESMGSFCLLRFCDGGYLSSCNPCPLNRARDPLMNAHRQAAGDFKCQIVLMIPSSGRNPSLPSALGRWAILLSMRVSKDSIFFSLPWRDSALYRQVGNAVFSRMCWHFLPTRVQ